jgi:hypothetical protein
MCVTKVWGVLGGIGVLGVNPGFTHFGGFRNYRGFGSISQYRIRQCKKPLLSNTSIQRYQYHTIYIYLYRGGLYRGYIWVKRGIMGYRPFY